MIGALLIALHGVLFIGIELYRFATASLQNADDVILSVIIAVIFFLVSLLVLKSTTRKKLVAALILGSPLAVLSIWGVWEGINSLPFYLYDDFFIQSIQNDTRLQNRLVGLVVFGVVNNVVLSIGSFFVIAGSIRDLRARKV